MGKNLHLTWHTYSVLFSRSQSLTATNLYSGYTGSRSYTTTAEYDYILAIGASNNSTYPTFSFTSGTAVIPRATIGDSNASAGIALYASVTANTTITGSVSWLSVWGMNYS